MTYDAVNQIITEKDPNIREQYKEITPMLDLAQDLSNRLIQMRNDVVKSILILVKQKY